MPPFHGTYALIYKAKEIKRVIIGKIGTLNIQPGFYVYVGSAFGPGGLKARIGHHRKKSAGRPHWHIDYLSAYLPPAEVWYTRDTAHREHQWSEIIVGSQKASVPLPGFGSSDCHCISHLYFFSSRPSANYFRRKIHAGIGNHARIFREKFLDKI